MVNQVKGATITEKTSITEKAKALYDKGKSKFLCCMSAKEAGEQYIAKAILILAALAVGAVFLALSKDTITDIFTTFNGKITEFMNSFTW